MIKSHADLPQAKTPKGWVSFVSRDGTMLLEQVEEQATDKNESDSDQISTVDSDESSEHGNDDKGTRYYGIEDENIRELETQIHQTQEELRRMKKDFNLKKDARNGAPKLRRMRKQKKLLENMRKMATAKLGQNVALGSISAEQGLPSNSGGTSYFGPSSSSSSDSDSEDERILLRQVQTLMGQMPVFGGEEEDEEDEDEEDEDEEDEEEEEEEEGVAAAAAAVLKE